MKLKRLQPIILASLLSSPLFAGFDAINPLQSTTHVANTASQNSEILFSWNKAIANSGDNLAGYYYILDQNESTLIPTVVELRSTLGSTATSISVTAPDEGTFHFHLAPYAEGGNIGATLHFKFIKIDTSAPTGLSVSPDGGSFNAIQTVSITATDSNNYTVYYTTDNSDPSIDSTVYSEPFTVASTQTVKSIAIDSAGNKSPIVSSAFTINNASNVAQFGNEVTTGSSIATTNSGGSARFIPALTVEGASVSEYKFKIDTTSYSAQIAKATAIDISGLQDGTHTVSILGYDGTSLQTEATTLNFIVDNTPPENILFSTPSSSDIISETTITMSSNNSNDIYYTTDGSLPDETSTKGTTVALNSTNNGTVTLRAISYDKAGNKSTVQEAIYIVNIPAPTDNGDNDSSSNTGGGSSSGGTTTPSIPDVTTPEESVTPEEEIVTPEEEDVKPEEEDVTPEENVNPQEEDLTPEENVTPEEEDDTSEEDTTPQDDGSSESISLPFTTDDGKEVSVNIDSDVENTTQTTNSDGSLTVSVSTENITNELHVNQDGTLNSSTNIGGATSNIEVNTIGADTKFNEDGSVVITSSILNASGSSISSNIEVQADGKMINSLNITVKDGTSTESIIKSDILGTDTIVANDGSMIVTTPTITTSTNQKVDFEIHLNVSGEIIPTLVVDGETVSLPQFEAGSVVSIKKELNKVLLEIETLLTEAITFN